MPDKLPEPAERMIREVGAKQRRMQRARAGKDNFWNSMSMLGVVGWSIAIPSVAGVIAGVWLDYRFPGRFSWALTLLFTGLVIGCANAWWQLRGGRQ